jgi:hypothetical protein
MNPRLLRVSFVAAVALVAPSVHAQANDAAAAQSLFNEGKKLMADKKYSEACPKFAESQRLDPGIGTMLWLAECHSKNGQTASAWALFHEAEALASKTKDPRVHVARAEAKKLEPKLSKLTIDASAVAGIEGVEIKRDGVVLGQPLWGTNIPTDPGSHRITVTAPDRKPWEGEVTVPDEAGSASITIPALELAPQPIEAPPPPPPPPPPTVVVVETKRGGTQRILGVVVGSVGLVGIGAGAFFGLRTGSQNDDSRTHCRPENRNLCDAEGVSLRDDAKTSAMFSNIGFIAGGALLVGGAVLFLTAPKSSTTKVGATPLPGGGAFAMQGTF